MTDLKKLRKLAEIAARHNGYGVFTTDECQNFSDAANPQAIIEILDMLERYREALVRARCEMLIVLENHSKVEMLSPLAIDEALEGGK